MRQHTGVSKVPPPYPESVKPEDIEKDIRHTRREMDETLDALGQRLHPRHLLDDVLDVFRGNGGNGDHRKMKRVAANVSKSAFRSVKNHPIPALLIGAGIAWLLMEDDEEEHTMTRYRPAREPEMYGGSYVDARTGEPYDDNYGEEWRHFIEAGEDSNEPGVVEKAKGRWRAAVEKMRAAGYSVKRTIGHDIHVAGGGIRRAGRSLSHRAGDIRHRAGDALHHGRERAARGMAYSRHRAADAYRYGRRSARDGYDYTRETVSETIDEYPLATGLAALAGGLLLGLMIPHSRREDEWIGPYSDDVKNRAMEYGEEAVERATDVAAAGADAAIDAAKREGLTPRRIYEKGRHVVERVADEARASAKREGLTADQMTQHAKHVGHDVASAAQNAAHEEGLSPDQLKAKAKGVLHEAKDAACGEADQHKAEVKNEVKRTTDQSF